MKKYLLSAVAFVAAMSASAQVEVIQVDADALGVGSDAVTLTKGTSFGEIAGKISAYAAYDDSYKSVDCKNNDYNKVSVDGQEILTKGGIQGQTNPKNDDGSPANTLKPATGGAVIGLTADADGWVYVVSKLSSNKQYTVFEEGEPIGYSLTMEIIDDHFADGVLSYKLVGEGEYNILPASMAPLPWAERIALNIPSHEETDAEGNVTVKYDYEIKKNGLGVIFFPVAADCKYEVCASGSKISFSGFAYSPTEATEVLVKNDDGAVKDILTPLTAVKTINVAPTANVNAPMYNVAGQQVNASYKGIVLQNGKKYINK